MADAVVYRTITNSLARIRAVYLRDFRRLRQRIRVIEPLDQTAIDEGTTG